MSVTANDMIEHYKRRRAEGHVRGMPTGEEILVMEIERLRAALAEAEIMSNEAGQAGIEWRKAYSDVLDALPDGSPETEPNALAR